MVPHKSFRTCNDIEDVRGLADGRIFTGEQARQNGLIDELGTLEDATRPVSGKDGRNIRRA